MAVNTWDVQNNAPIDWIEFQAQDEERWWVLASSVASIAGLSALILASNIPNRATADEFQLADASNVIEAAMTWETVSDALPPELAWVANLDLNNPSVARILDERLPGFPHFQPFLRELSTYTPQKQADIAGFLVWAWWPNTSLDERLINLISEWRVPETLRLAIIDEVTASDANRIIQRWIPAALEKLALEWDFSSSAGNNIMEYAPNSGAQLPIIQARLVLEQDLVDAQDDLSDAQWRLDDLWEISSQQDSILDKN